MTAKQRKGASISLFPQTIAVSGLGPLTKVFADYQPPPKNKFLVKINDYDYYTLAKEDVDVNLNTVELFNCRSL